MRALSGLLSTLPSVWGAEVGAATELDPLLDVEQPFVDGVSAKRRWDFQAGRHCARQALERLGLAACPIPRSDGGAPVWPEQVVGSIAHTGRSGEAWAGAVVARREAMRAVGFDAERRAPFKPALWPKILTAEEQTALAAVAPVARELIVLATFSAKEAAYKGQAPLTNRYLGFTDVRISWHELPAPGRRGRFSAQFGCNLEPVFKTGPVLIWPLLGD